MPEQLAAEQRGGAGDVVGDHHRGHAVGVVAALEEVGVGEDRPAAAGDPHVAVGQQRAGRSEQRRGERVELVGMPAVVLVGQRDQARRSGAMQIARSKLRRNPSRSRRAADDESRIVPDLALELGERRGEE